MIHVISKSTFGDYNVRDIQCNANWCSCPYSDYALIPDSMVEEILATCGYCDITLNEEGTEVVSFVARENPNAPIEIVCPALVETKEEFDGVIGAELDGMPVGGVKTIYVKDPNNAVGVGATCYTVTMHKNAHNPFPTFYEHCCMADIEIHGYGEYKAWGVKPYNGDGAGEKWSISDPQLVLVEEHMADRVTAKGATDDGWTWEKWRSGKFEAWRDFNESVGGAIDLGSGNFYRYQYRYEFALPFESKTTPHVFVTLRSSGENLLVGVTPERGSKWWTVDSFDESLQEFGTDFQSVQEAFESDFDYDLTVDQQKCVEAIKKDMTSPRPMDRLVCGDVGYGKTEVAMRAAFKAVLGGKQVCMLAPTTILSRQHYHTFKKRMDKYGVRVELLSRFVSKTKQEEVIDGIKSGSVDVVVGTHRVLSNEITFKALGLLIVDEEQRFGVTHKEKIKELKVEVDCITLTATPIPRTLQMSVMGIKDLSMIETPPKNRYPIQTYVLERNDRIIADAIMREMARGGQVFYLYNRVDSIEEIKDKLHQLVPDAKIGVGHGKLSKDQLEPNSYIWNRRDSLTEG